MSSELEKFVAQPPAPVATEMPPTESPKVVHISAFGHDDICLQLSSVLPVLCTLLWHQVLAYWPALMHTCAVDRLLAKICLILVILNSCCHVPNAGCYVGRRTIAAAPDACSGTPPEKVLTHCPTSVPVSRHRGWGQPLWHARG